MMETTEAWRDEVGGRLEDLAKQLTQDGYIATAICTTMVAGAVYDRRELALARWIVWFVRWRMLCRRFSARWNSN